MLESKSFMEEWPAVMREDRVRVEIICPHGVGHPSRELSSIRWDNSWMAIHGCCRDGCCQSAAFRLAELTHLENR